MLAVVAVLLGFLRMTQTKSFPDPLKIPSDLVCLLLLRHKEVCLMCQPRCQELKSSFHVAPPNSCMKLHKKEGVIVESFKLRRIPKFSNTIFYCSKLLFQLIGIVFKLFNFFFLR